jgi:hypothetical protein
MKSKNPNCVRRIDPAAWKRTPVAIPPAESDLTQVLQQLKRYSEGLTLELAARLRVLEKSLATACPGHGSDLKKKPEDSVPYKNLRRQLDIFLSSLENHHPTGAAFFPTIRQYLEQSLPYELQGCGDGEPCRIGWVEAVVSILSAYSNEADG